MLFLSYTIFEDARMKIVRSVANLKGETAKTALGYFKNGLKREPKEGDVWAGCRIDRIDFTAQ